MGLVEAAVSGIHLLFASVWTGSVVFVTLAVLPTAANGEANATPLATVTSKLTTLSRVSAVVLLATGAHLALTRYPGAALVQSVRGNLVLLMAVLWLVLAALVEVGSSRLASGFAEKKVRSPARAARNYFRAASLVAVLLLVDAGVLLGL